MVRTPPVTENAHPLRRILSIGRPDGGFADCPDRFVPFRASPDHPRCRHLAFRWADHPSLGAASSHLTQSGARGHRLGGRQILFPSRLRLEAIDKAMEHNAPGGDCAAPAPSASRRRRTCSCRRPAAGLRKGIEAYLTVADRSAVAQAAYHGDLSQHRRMGAATLRRRSRRPCLFRKRPRLSSRSSKRRGSPPSCPIRATDRADAPGPYVARGSRRSIAARIGRGAARPPGLRASTAESAAHVWRLID